MFFTLIGGSCRLLKRMSHRLTLLRPNPKGRLALGNSFYLFMGIIEVKPLKYLFGGLE